MTTRKQMNARLAERRERGFEETRRSGLEAQRRDREYRENLIRNAQRDMHDKKHSKKVDQDCLYCRDRQKANRKEMDELQDANDH